MENMIGTNGTARSGSDIVRMVDDITTASFNVCLLTNLSARYTLTLLKVKN